MTAGGHYRRSALPAQRHLRGVNDVHAMLGLPPFGIKYEKCEIILCTVDESLKNTGITVMDGPFFSLMPFGQTRSAQPDQRDLYPPRDQLRQRGDLPLPAGVRRGVQAGRPVQLQRVPGQARQCLALHEPAGPQIFKEEYGFAYHSSLFSMKPILKASEVDDSRPTVVRVMCDEPKLVSVLSGKINTVYDLDEVLEL